MMTKIASIEGIPEALQADPTRRKRVSGSSFTDALARFVDAVDHAQVSADAEAKKLALGGGNLHETAIALEEADVSMRFLVRTRNKAVEAYQDIMRMQL